MELKHHLTSAPVLPFPEYSLPFILDTDASGTGVGAVLSQVQEGEERVIAYASRTLTKQKRRYCVTKRELLAVVTFVRHFRHYLLGCTFELRTDHGSLTWLQNFKEPEGQLGRWLEELQEFNVEIIHRRGRSHGNAVALSRMPCGQCGHSHGDHDEELNGLVCMITESPREPATESIQDIRQLQCDDEAVGLVLKAREAGRKPDEIAGKGQEMGYLVQLWDQLIVRNGVLYKEHEDEHGSGSHFQLVVPRQSREEILQDIHGGAVWERRSL